MIDNSFTKAILNHLEYFQLLLQPQQLLFLSLCVPTVIISLYKSLLNLRSRVDPEVIFLFLIVWFLSQGLFAQDCIHKKILVKFSVNFSQNWNTYFFNNPGKL